MIFLQQSGEQSPKRPHKPATQAKIRGGNQIQNGVFPKHDGMGNGIINDVQPDVIQSKLETKKDKVITHRTMPVLSCKNMPLGSFVRRLFFSVVECFAYPTWFINL